MKSTKGFYITDPGDESVGIFPGRWTLEGEFNFEDELEFEEFKNQLSATFENVTFGPVVIMTFEETEEIEKGYLTALNPDNENTN